MEIIKIKYSEGVEPIRKIKVGDWIDLRCAEDITLEVGEYKMIPLGVAMQLPEGYEAIVAPRSSTFKNYGIIMTNSIGIIDETYCGDNDIWHFPALCMQARSFENGKHVTKIPKGERICQFRIIEHQPKTVFLEVKELGNTDRNGFGSTGKR